MGTFAKTAIVDNCLSFADQEKQTSVSVCNKQTEVYHFRFLLVPFSFCGILKPGDM
jgi:hypothetical protein